MSRPADFEYVINYTERMNCPNLARAFDALWKAEPSKEELDEALWYIEREVQLRNQWSRPLRFDTASGQPVGHLPEDDQMFQDYLKVYGGKSELEVKRRELLYGLWCADMTNGAEVLRLVQELVSKRFSEVSDA